MRETPSIELNWSLNLEHLIKISKKLQMENLENSEGSESSEFFFQIFFSWVFSFGYYVKIEKSEEKKLETKFGGFRVFNLTSF